MKSRQLRPLRVYETLTHEMANRILPQYQVHEPAWYKVVNKIPPAEIATRPIPIRHKAFQSNSRKPKKIWMPQNIVYEEDALRATFFKEHPWELARPRVVLEADGKDHQKVDWSKGVRQRGIPLSGECVVQRQMWLMHEGKKTKHEAYDIARREFYALRQEEEIERRVQREEARHVGAYFGMNKNQISQVLEDKEFDLWKSWAKDEVTRVGAARASAYADFGSDPEAAEAGDEVVEEEIAP
ncbi:37S ribosomal protein Rsm25 [Plectosphaerella plurivora]|uniref:Small ribosomal subunit protein mS23 n=1 Tax=Plectosphaerella plurivora TaxID=936078 RepID=A0A9P8VKW2_9PEZI|nr:37S ribosomal protein Rsm25 [Plectosphaerella plurivora]